MINLPIQSVSQEIWESKYQLKSIDGSVIDSNIDATFERVALALADLELDKYKWEDAFLWALKNGAIPGGRIIANAGAKEHKPFTSTINCTVSGTIEDSMDSILSRLHDAGLTLKSGAGIGYCFSTLRPKGAYVAGAGAQTSGPLSFMDIFDKMCFTISSAGGRRGAQMATFDIGHPDIQEFITAKREPGRLRQFNLSVLITDGFMRALAEDGEWGLSFAGKEYRKIRARELWDLIMRSTYDYAEPGIMFIDRVNELNNLNWCEDIRASNPCVTADTWVQTNKGARQVSSLIETPTTVLVDGIPYFSARGFFKTAIKDVVKLFTKEGFALRLTPDHKVKKVLYKTPYILNTEWVPVGDLLKGDKILLNNHRETHAWGGEYTYNQGYLIGALIGDGVLMDKKAFLSVWNVDGGVNGVIEKVSEAVKELKKRSDFQGWKKIPNSIEQRLVLVSLKDLAIELGMKRRDKCISPKMEMASSAFYRGFLQGFFDADGSVQGTQQKGVSVRLSQSDLARLEAVQRMLLRLGIKSNIYTNRRAAGVYLFPNGKGGSAYYKVKSNHELVISGDNLLIYNELIGFANTVKANRLNKLLSTYRRKLNKEHFIATVDSITPDGTEDVYDIQVPGINAFDANGLYIHNCGEQFLPPYGACLLGSINLTKFVEKPFTNSSSFDYEKYRSVIRVFTRMLDNVVEINGLPLKSQQTELEYKRRHGMGYLGLGSAMTMLGIRYGSDASLGFTQSVTYALAHTGYETGIELAKEKGVAPILQNKDYLEKFCNSKYIQRLSSYIVDDIRRYGCRFTHHSAIAPTGTISLALANNASNGVEPSFAHLYKRNIIKPGKKTKEQVDVYSYEYLLFREMFGSNAKLTDNFVTANDIDPIDHIEVQAKAQYWIDSAISKTINVPSDYPYEKFKKLYELAYNQGLKGCTTFRYNPKQFSGVLVKDEDLQNTKYKFVLSNGKVIECSGSEQIEYEGEIHNAANLYDAIKEGYYSKL